MYVGYSLLYLCTRLREGRNNDNVCLVLFAANVTATNGTGSVQHSRPSGPESRVTADVRVTGSSYPKMSEFHRVILRSPICTAKLFF